MRCESRAPSRSRTGRLRAGLVTGLILPLAFGACTGGYDGTTAGAVSELRILDYYTSTTNNVPWERALDVCGRVVGVEIDRESVPVDALMQRVLQRSSSKTLPDVLMLDNPDVQQVAASGALTPLEDLGIDTAGVADGVLRASTYEGDLYGLQPVTNTVALFYNKKFLDAAGVVPPTTWEELEVASARLTQGDRYGFAMSNIGTFEGTWQFLPFMWSNGGDERNIDTPQTAAALQLVKDLMTSGSLSQSSVNWPQDEVTDHFIAGNAAMMINGPWSFPALERTADLEYGVVPIPAPRAGGEIVLPFGGEAWTVPQTGDEEKQKKAAELVQCLNRDDIEVELALRTGTVPTKPALADQIASRKPHFKAFTDQVPNLRARTGELGPDWPEAATRIHTAVQEALVGGMTPEDALEQAQNG